MTKQGRIAVWGGLAVLLLFGVGAGYRYVARARGSYQPEPLARAEERELQAKFLGDLPATQRFDALYDYFLRGFLRHATPSFSRVHYSGVGSKNGTQVTGLEGFARTAPLLAMRVYSGRDHTAFDPRTGATIDIVDVLRRGILAGVSPGSPDYWGRIHDFDQRIVESADIARVLWLTRASLWDKLGPEDKSKISTWLRQAAVAKTAPSNWMLFPVIDNLVLAKLDAAGAAEELASARQRFDDYRRYYLESGWFFDVPHGVDFYNTWGINYELFWIHTISPDFEPDFLLTALRESAALTAHLISPTGLPIMGRSICYRTAVPVPVIAESLVDPANSGQAFRALDVVWRYFVAHDSLRDGALSQGYVGTDLRILDAYSGAGSCQLGVRSLVLAFMHPKDDPFWTAPAAALPVESGDYSLEYPKLGWKIIGRQATGEIVIEIPRNDPDLEVLEPYTWTDRALEALTLRPHRPTNSLAKYQSRRYSSAQPFVLLGNDSKAAAVVQSR
jgi:hypothetical protein